MMIVNPDNLQAIITDRKKQQNNPTSIKVNDVNINSENSVRLLRLEKISSVEIRKLRTMALEVFKSLNDLSPSFMKESFHKKNKTTI